MDKTDKLLRRIEYLIKLEYPAPHCPQKQKAHRELIEQVKKDLAQKLYPKGIEISINVG